MKSGVSAGQDNVGSVDEYCSNYSKTHVKDRATKTLFNHLERFQVGLCATRPYAQEV